MSNEIMKASAANLMQELQDTQKLCQMLMAQKHYAKMGTDGIYAIVEKAKSMGVSPPRS